MVTSLKRARLTSGSCCSRWKHCWQGKNLPDCLSYRAWCPCRLRRARTCLRRGRTLQDFCSEQRGCCAWLRGARRVQRERTGACHGSSPLDPPRGSLWIPWNLEMNPTSWYKHTRLSPPFVQCMQVSQTQPSCGAFKMDYWQVSAAKMHGQQTPEKPC